MPTKTPVRSLPIQRGQAALGLLFLLFAAGVGTLLFVLGGNNSSRQNLADDRITFEALAEAKEALISWGINDSLRPGILPCPDTNNDGIAEPISSNECPSYIGRLPWKSLGLSELRDGSGELLWYALSRNFRNDATAEPINTDTKGSLTVHSGSTAATLTTEAAAVVFAPGAALSAQDRSSTTSMSCPAPSGTIARNLCADNYLESIGAARNASNSGPYITAQSSTTFNDRLLVISAADVMIPVEMRAAREIIGLLRSYKTESVTRGTRCNCYPWADFYDGVSNTGRYEGRVPLERAYPDNWAALGISVAPWLLNNRWWWVFFYTLSGADSEYHSGGTLNVNGAGGYSVVLISTGAAGANRPAGSLSYWEDGWWSYYVDDSGNADLGSYFNTPSSTAFNRDRLYSLP